jgi:hypothetical protein
MYKLMNMTKIFYTKINSKNYVAIIFVIIVSIIGTTLLLYSHASTPYGAVNADNGTLGNDATVQNNASASDGKAVQFGSTVITTPAGSEAQVPDSPDVPSTGNPSGGWTLEYGDAFGSASLEQGGQDNTYFPNDAPSCAAHEGFETGQEIENFTCGQVSTNPSTGLTLTCSYGAPPDSKSGGPAINYDCGAAIEGSSQEPTSGYQAFSWKDPVGSGNIIAVQWEWQLPPDYQFDPAVWGTGAYTGADSNDGDEIDNIEAFGWGVTNWSQANFTLPTIVGGSPYTSLKFGFDPSAGMNTYTVVYNGANNTSQGYINGRQVSSGTLKSTGPEYQTLIWSLAMRGGWSGCSGTGCGDPVPGFTSGSHSLTMRYAGYYEDTAHAGQGVEVVKCDSPPCIGGGEQGPAGNPPLIAPGSSIESSASTQSSYQQINTQPY